MLVKDRPDLIAILNDTVAELPLRRRAPTSASDQNTFDCRTDYPSPVFLYRRKTPRHPSSGDPNAHIIAIKREKSTLFGYSKIHSVRLMVGDIVLVRCSIDKLQQIQRGADFHHH
ncbi:MAG: hypothetical protein SRB2_02946 [Desulfobacteraceae bacterium Eth-SRB2]|nr:MAG: hypothetical protein SRB2_02946 [Desulfobacteraceae bacterium Eth-SRB2]